MSFLRTGSGKTEVSVEAEEERRQRLMQMLWRGKIAPAFWTITGSLSLVVNIILIVILLVLAGQLFRLKSLVTHQLIGGLYDNFVLMDQAKIQTNVTVNTTIPVKFELPVKTNTTVVLTEDTQIQNASVTLVTGGVMINAPADIILPGGTSLPIALDITVPVDTTVPVVLNVPVDIPLNQTELHQPFVGLKSVVAPYYDLLNSSPDSWSEVICGPKGNWFCKPSRK